MRNLAIIRKKRAIHGTWLPLIAVLAFNSLLENVMQNNICASEKADVAQTSTKGDPENTFKLPRRKTNSTKSDQSFDLKKSVGDTGIKVGIGLGIILITVLMLSKKRNAKPLPREAIEILGSVPMASRQQIQLIRFGQKLVLVESSGDGLKPISEITDPTEVNQMLDLIRPRTQ